MMVTCLLFVVSTITAATATIDQIQQYSREIYTSYAAGAKMGKAISKETVEIVNNQLNSNEQLKAHISEAMESHRNTYVSATIIVLIIMAVFLLVIYACSKYCLLKCKENMNGDKRDVSYYASRSPYPGYANHFRRFSSRFAENGDENVEAGEISIGTKSHGTSSSRVRTSEFN